MQPVSSSPQKEPTNLSEAAELVKSELAATTIADYSVCKDPSHKDDDAAVKLMFILLVIWMAIAGVIVFKFAPRQGSGTNWAGASPMSKNAVVTITGMVRLEGFAPKPAHINMVSDPSCVRAHPGGATAEDIVVGPTGSLANVIVYVSEGLSELATDPPKEEVAIAQKGCMYQPHVVAVQANQKLRIINEDRTLHNIHPLPQNNREWNKSQPPGMEPMEESFPRQEIAIPVKCNVHPWMKGYIGVFKHPYFAVSGKDGSFEIKNLPLGTYTIQAWHEKFGTLTQRITVEPGTGKVVSFVFRSKANN